MDKDLVPESEIWKQIDQSESYMVCSMFEEAASRAESIVKHIRSGNLLEEIDPAELAEMMESAGMVYVQSLKELGRTGELISELKVLFGSVVAIPVQVFLTGSCMQIAEGYVSNLRPIFEEFFEYWVYLKDEVNVLRKAELQRSSEQCIWQPFISVDKYLEVAEIYAVTTLGMILKKTDLAISWTERAGLPEEKRQDMLRRLQSLHLASHSDSSANSGTVPAKDRNDRFSTGTSSAASASEVLPSKYGWKPVTLKSIQPSFRLKFGNFQLLLPRGKVLFFGPLVLLAFYILRKKRAVVMRIIRKQASSLRKALIDAWQLAFSVQVNPLAAVQQLPSSAPRGSR